MWFNAPVKRKPLFRLALAGVVLAVLAIMLGAFTRLVDAGLGCPDWPTCYGHALWPDEAHEIHAANAAFPETPVEAHKTWPEQVHRLAASGLGLISLLVFFLSLRQDGDRRLKTGLCVLVLVWVSALVAKIAIKANSPVTAAAMHGQSDIVIGLVVLGGFVLLALLGWRRTSSSRQPLCLPALLVGLVILQGLFGMWTVTLKVWPQVVTVHLLGGFATLSLFWLLVLRLDNRVWWLKATEVNQLLPLRPWALVALLLVVAQIALGGWTTSNYAAVACPDLPTCQHQWWPETDFAQGFNVFQHIGPNYLGGYMDNAARVAIHLSHRIGAVLVVLGVVALLAALWRSRCTEARRLALVILGLLLLQVALGISNVLFHFPLAVAVAHNIGGALLLLSLVTLLHRLHTLERR